jgi:hypothetical protein
LPCAVRLSFLAEYLDILAEAAGVILGSERAGFNRKYTVAS